MTTPTKRLGALTALVAGALLTACSMTLSLNGDQLEQAITTGISEQMGVTVTVVCPDDRPMQQGDVFTCTATTAEGESRTVEVTQTDSAGNVNWRLV